MTTKFYAITESLLFRQNTKCSTSDVEHFDSKTDLECIEAVFDKFSDKDQFELAEITHKYPEWIKHKKELDDGKKRVKMDYNDFFADSQKGDALFSQNKAYLEMARESFAELREVSAFFAK